MRRLQGSSKSAARAAAEALFAQPAAMSTSSSTATGASKPRTTRVPASPEKTHLGQNGHEENSLGKGRAANAGKTWCCEADIFVGPDHGRLRVWHRHPPRDTGAGRDGRPRHQWTLAEIFPRVREADPVKLRMALRKERRAGLSGAIGYSIERHSALASALAIYPAHGAESRCQMS